MRIRLSLTLDVRRGVAEPEYVPAVDSNLGSVMERPDAPPPIGFQPQTLDPDERHERSRRA